jgi:hypothetical protein
MNIYVGKTSNPTHEMDNFLTSAELCKRGKNQAYMYICACVSTPARIDPPPFISPQNHKYTMWRQEQQQVCKVRTTGLKVTQLQESVQETSKNQCKEAAIRTIILIPFQT